MKIDDVIANLKRVRAEEGNIEVTCTGSLLPDGHGSIAPIDKGDIFETTVENFIVNNNHPLHGKAVRLWL